ncbi:MAG: DUF2007 domain-containing protein [Phycisphaerales bacterium]|jgi:hypothetical protein|nr:DUF2007 domain-containing protein [Phycisphaerales bacterium]
MKDDPQRPVVLTTRPMEAQAAMVAAVLRDEGIPAELAGMYTAGFRAEAPGVVQVLVRQGDLERAKEILAELEGTGDGVSDDDLDRQAMDADDV